jgi:aminoglycoside phosphotransferase (APT) family kinase protein
VAPYLEAAAAVLAQVHGLPWSQALPDWAAPRGADAELATWAALLTRTGDPGWIAAGTRLREALAATAPAEPPVGLFHGDFQTHNILFDPDGGKVLAVVDWEIAGIGLQGLDVGWLAVMTDPSFWAREHQDRMDVVAPEGAVREWYEDAVGRTLADYDWYRALAAYRFGVIAAFNIRLHRTGRRPDASYELLVSSVERLFSRGLELTGRGAPRSEVGA